MLKKIILKGEQKKVLFLPPTKPIQIKGVAGSGKTTVALYRAKHLLETQSSLFQEANIAIFTFNKTLAAYIKSIGSSINGGYQQNSDDIIPKSNDGLDVAVVNFHSWAFKFLGLQFDQTIMQYKQVSIIRDILTTVVATDSNILSKSAEFFQEEISWIKGKLFFQEEDYVEAKRIGRGTSDRVTQKDKRVIWNIYNLYQAELQRTNKIDFDDYAILCLSKISNDKDFIPPYSHIIIDEAQDLSKAQILTISKIVSSDTESLSIIADAAQRIYKSGFTWSEVGINVRGGRTIEFKKNYRNSIHIAQAAISLLENEQDKSEFTTVETALSGGEKPKKVSFDDVDDEMEYLGDELSELKTKGLIGGTVVLHRNHDGVRMIEQYLKGEGFLVEKIQSGAVDYNSDAIKLCTMSSIKGLEFNNVFIADLNDDVIPYPPGFIEADDEFHISTERRLLYTCMTRAKNKLYLLSSGKKSRYLDEIYEEYVEVVENQLTSKAYSTVDDLPF